MRLQAEEGMAMWRPVLASQSQVLAKDGWELEGGAEDSISRSAAGTVHRHSVLQVYKQQQTGRRVKVVLVMDNRLRYRWREQHRRLQDMA